MKKVLSGFVARNRLHYAFAVATVLTAGYLVWDEHQQYEQDRAEILNVLKTGHFPLHLKGYVSCFADGYSRIMADFIRRERWVYPVATMVMNAAQEMQYLMRESAKAGVEVNMLRQTCARQNQPQVMT